MKECKRFLYGGGRYTAREISKMSGKSLATVYEYARAGLFESSDNQCMCRAMKGRRRKLVMFEGVEMTREEICKLTGYSRSYITILIKQGRLAKYEGVRNKSYMYTTLFEGEYRTLQEICDLTGYSYSWVSTKNARNELYDLEGKRRNGYHKGGVIPQLHQYGDELLTVAEICERTGLSQTCVRDRLKM